jgi:hypothetical protein
MNTIRGSGTRFQQCQPATLRYSMGRDIKETNVMEALSSIYARPETNEVYYVGCTNDITGDNMRTSRCCIECNKSELRVFWAQKMCHI